MRYSQYKAFDKHLKDAFPSNFSSLYCLIAKDAGERSLAFDEIKACAHLATVTLFSAEAYQDLITALETGSLFGGKQIFCLHSAEKLSKAGQTALEKTFAHIPKDTILVISAESLSKVSNFYKAIDKQGVILDIGEEKPWEKEKNLAVWILERAAKHKKTIEADAVNALSRGVQGSFAKASIEWEKLLTYVGNRVEIRHTDVEAICHLVQTDSNWLFGESILSFNGKAALEAAFRMLDSGASVFPILRQLRHQVVSALYLITSSDSVIAEKFPYLKGQMLEKQLQTARHFGQERLTNALLVIDELEFKAKDSWDDPKLLLTLLCSKVLS